MRNRLWSAMIATIVLAASHGMASLHAEVTSVRVARQYGIGYLQVMVMEHEKLLEKQAKVRGLGDLSVTWSTFTDGAMANDAVISGNLDFVAGGLGSFITLWDRTRDSLAVKGVAALNSMPMLLNTRNPGVRTIKDLTDQDRIAVAGVKVSSQAVTLQLAAAQAFGDANWDKLDALTVNMAHPTAMQALLSGRSEITTHFASPPYQYEELKHPGVRTVLNSYDVWGGPQTFIAVWTTSKFRDQNPKTYAAFLAAVAEATELINKDRLAAARTYLHMTGDKSMSAEDLARMLADPQLRFTLTPENVVKFASFRARMGSIKTRPDSWKDLFFPDLHHLPGS
ncbi:MAG TPA: ABC transporter substrate-binding protein [Casimicrobiaceae bacterium]|nr:ABC transporter substrate-binding protein [Casimicrobiaceae bacterium]